MIINAVSGDGCSDPGTPANAKQLATSYNVGDVVTFKCTQPGFEISNNKQWKCVASYTGIAWNQPQGSLPECIGE